MFHLIVGAAALAVLLTLPIGRAMVGLAAYAVLGVIGLAVMLIGSGGAPRRRPGGAPSGSRRT
jgi:hypothetical protein